MWVPQEGRALLPSRNPCDANYLGPHKIREQAAIRKNISEFSQLLGYKREGKSLPGVSERQTALFSLPSPPPPPLHLLSIVDSFRTALTSILLLSSVNYH